MLFTGNKTAFIYDDSSIEVLSPKTGKVKVLQRGSYFGRYSLEGSSFIFTIRRYSECFSNLYHLETRGTPVPLLEDVAGIQLPRGTVRFLPRWYIHLLQRKIFLGNLDPHLDK